MNGASSRAPSHAIQAVPYKATPSMSPVPGFKVFGGRQRKQTLRAASNPLKLDRGHQVRNSYTKFLAQNHGQAMTSQNASKTG